MVKERYHDKIRMIRVAAVSPNLESEMRISTPMKSFDRGL